MPPVNQGSRAALITWMVIAWILFLTASIFSVYYYAQANKSAEELSTLTKQYNEIIASANITSAEVSAVKAEISAAGDPGPAAEMGLTRSMTVVDALLAKITYLDKLIAGTGADEAKAIAGAKNSMKNAGDRAKGSIPNLPQENVTQVIDLLATAVDARQTEVANLKTQVKAAQDALARKQVETDAAIKAKDQQIETIRAEQTATAGGVTTVSADYAEKLKAVQAEKDALQKTVQETQNASQVAVADLSSKLAKAVAERDAARVKLESLRPDTAKPVLDQVDGKIVRLPGDGVAFIDRGSGDQIIPGMTFEIYDRYEGVPQPIKDPASPGTIALPRGKAAIEVTRVGATSSECRIISTTPGATLAEGDVIANLIYDRNTKNKFFVYGEFNFGRGSDEKLTPEAGKRDAETMKRLITQWGGSVVDQVTADTDFVVLGREPVVPIQTKEDDVVATAKAQAAKAAADAYDDVKRRAAELHIPVLNQNRFLYLIGYYEQARR